MFGQDAKKRSEDLTHQLALILDQSNLALNLLYENPYANINLNLLQIEKAITTCRATILVYVKE